MKMSPDFEEHICQLVNWKLKAQWARIYPNLAKFVILM
jgi:hypothetical protein